MLINMSLCAVRRLLMLLIVLLALLIAPSQAQTRDDTRRFLSPLPAVFLMPPPPVPAPVWSDHLPSLSFAKRNFATLAASIEFNAQPFESFNMANNNNNNNKNQDNIDESKQSTILENDPQTTIQTTPTQVPNNSESEFGGNNGLPAPSSFEDNDVYVPYNSDVHDRFSWALLRNILQQETENNVVISPFSIKLLMALLLEATGDNSVSQRELSQALEDDVKSPENLRGFYKKLLTSIKKENPYHTLDLETRIFANNHIEPRQRYAALLRTFYNTTIDRVSFNEVEQTMQYINDWASKVTNGHIQQLVNEENIRDKEMILANAIYFMGLWHKQFNDTHEDGPFFLREEESVPVKYMEQTEYFYYYENDELNVKMVRLPYKGRKFSMFIVLPNTIDGLSSLIEQLENDQLKRMQFLMEEVKMTITVPKFRFEYGKDLRETLEQLGIREIFTDNASLPALSRHDTDDSREDNLEMGNLKVSAVFQKAGIDVNERGTEAFAATLVEIDNKFGGPPDLVEFTVNRPFMFFIEEEATGSIIFAGKILDPRH